MGSASSYHAGSGTYRQESAAMRGYVAPKLDRRTFTCPYCGVYALHWWAQLVPLQAGNYYPAETGLHRSKCLHCDRRTVWVGDGMVYPMTGNAPLPNEDLSEDIRADYEEARDIV